MMSETLLPLRLPRAAPPATVAPPAAESAGDRALDPVPRREPAGPTVGVAEFALLAHRDVEYAGRTTIRRAVLALHPEQDAEYSLEKAMRRRPPGVTWKLVAADGLTVGLRARDFSRAERAAADIVRLAASHDRLRPLIVRDPATGRLSFWILRDAQVVVVGVRLLQPRQRRAVERDAERVLRSLRRPAGPAR